jgi:tRNA (guanine37-N1)-methyltransferase
LRFDIVTLFPDFFSSPLASGLIGRALTQGLAQVNRINPRDFTTDKHHRVDDIPYGGGVGMVLKPEPIFAAIESIDRSDRSQVIFMTPQGETMNQGLFQELVTNYDQLVILCGQYEGVDERIRANLIDREISLGDFVLTGGEIPALTLINGVTRLIPGTVGKADSLKYESFENLLLDYPQYTRPVKFREWEVPAVLRSGNHQAIDQWRLEQQKDKTRDRRPDLWAQWEQQHNSSVINSKDPS